MKEWGLMWICAHVFHSPGRGVQPFSIGAVRRMQKSKKRHEWTEQKRDRTMGWGGRRERQCVSQWKNKLIQCWIVNGMRGRSRPQWTWKPWWLMGHGRGCRVESSLVTSRLARRTLGTMCGRQRPSISITLCSLSAIRDTWETRTWKANALVNVFHRHIISL